MLRYILLKIKNKYKLYLCLFVGLLFMEAVVALIFMFRTGSLNKLIQKNFIEKYEENESFPAVLSRITSLDGDQGTIKDIITEINSYEASWEKYLDVPFIAKQQLIYMKGLNADLSFGTDRKKFDIGYMEGMREHIDIVDGGTNDLSTYLPNGYKIPDKATPCYVSEYTADDYNLVVGEVLNFEGISESNDDKYLYIAGILKEKQDDYYWNKSLAKLGHMLYVDGNVFDDFMGGESVIYEMYSMLDYRYIDEKNASRISSILSQFHQKDEMFYENISAVITAYERESRFLTAILYVIALPIVLLVLIFILMIAVRIVDSQMGEITCFFSRGLNRKRIIVMYAAEYLILCAVTFIPGLLLGYLLGRVAARVDDFLGFHIGVNASTYTFTWQMIPAALIALVVAEIVMLIPVILRSKSTLVDYRNKSAKIMTKPMWEKYFVDVALLIVSLYLLHNYNLQLDMLSQAVIDGNDIDPMIFADATLFLVAAGLIILRLIFAVMRLIYKLFGQRLSPVGFAGLLQVMRTRKSSSIVSVFMVVTVAMSLFNANTARTINANNEQRINIDLGADYIVGEHFELKIKGQEPPQTWKYIEPDPAIYDEVVKKSGLSCYTKVIKDENAEARNGSKVVKNATLMGINTKEFGLTGNMKENVGKEHWYNYLNLMADKPNGCVVSKNLADELKLHVGDTFTYSRIAPVDSVGIYASTTGSVVAIVDVWPGYEKFRYTYNEEGKQVCEERYLVVANFATVVNTFGITPYEIWLKGNGDVKGTLDNALTGTDRRIDYFKSNEKNVSDMKSSALIQITNGIFTVNFLVSVMLCVLGFMIFWISAMRDREHIFGIYRAMGLSFKEIEKMLFIEQLFLTLVSIVAGVVSGGLATILFGKIFAVVYLPKKHSLPIENVIAMSDMVRLFAVLIIAVVICMAIIKRIVKGLNIANAIKLGED
ncbi:MAG: ABC transporter permease [Lachnospiraceae bacterium]|nr:ABC transporter permease [Lachnospiraceae bacterium]